MMRMKAAADPVMEYSPYDMYEAQRTRFKHQSLMQDFEELQKETEATRKKLEMMKERKLTMLAEVRFLRRRYKFLMQNQKPSNTPAERNFVLQPQNMMIRSKSNSKEKKRPRKDLQCQAMGIDLNQKGKTYSEKETTFTHPSLVFDLNQKQRKHVNGKEKVALQSSLLTLDLNQRERLYSGKEATARNKTPIFDLNQISREEEELQANNNPVRIEEFKKSSNRIASDEPHNDIKISACRNTGNGPNRVGKRKISWQDPLALRV